MTYLTDIKRFEAKVNKTEGCWLWTARVLPNGYAIFYFEGNHTYAHRWSYEQFVGPIPSGHQVDHVKDRGCTNRHCVNPVHLEAVTAKVNNGRSASLSAAHATKTHCPQGHEYDAGNTYLHRGMRYCKACRRKRHREWTARQKTNPTGGHVAVASKLDTMATEAIGAHAA